MQNELTGYTPLHALMQRAIENGVEKRAAAMGTPVKKDEPKEDKTTVVEKTASDASGLDFSNPDHMSKLAEALEEAGEKIAAAGVENGGEVKGGGEQIPNGKPVSGKQSYKKDAATPAHQSATDAKKTSTHPDAVGGAGTLNGDNMGAGVKPGYPKKGVLKTAGADLLAKLRAKGGEKKDEKDDDKKDEKKDGEQEKKSSAVETILGEMGKVAETHGGGETLDDKPAPVPSNPGRQMIASNAAPKAATKREAKAPRKAELSQVLTEPALSKAHDSKVHDNLQNASKGGVKIAGVAKALLQKIAEEGCTCGGKGECRYCKMKEKVDAAKAKKS
jgi:hypothetical protein